MDKIYNKKCTEAMASINTKETYDLSSFAKLMWWTNKRDYTIKLIDKDKELGNILQVETTGQGTGMRYKIAGRNIIKFFKTYGPGISLLK